MTRFEGRIEILRMQIANQRDAPMPERDALIKQRDGSRASRCLHASSERREVSTRVDGMTYIRAHAPRVVIRATPVEFDARDAACLRESSACRA